jgi:hypothetical protein
MNSGRWEEPVTFETQKLGVYRTIASAEEAARALLTDWPAQSGPAFMEAQKACLAVLEGRKAPEAAIARTPDTLIARIIIYIMIILRRDFVSFATYKRVYAEMRLD